MSAQGQISRKFMFMMAMTCALCAGCNYFNQPLIYSIAEDLHISVAQSSWTVVLTQIGYATGLFLFVPLGDLFEKRLYICSLMLCTGLALMGMTYGPIGTVLSEIFPTSVRYTGSALTFNLAGIFGASFAPLIATKLATTYGLYAVGYYLSAASILSLMAFLAIRETKNDDVNNQI